MIRLRKSTHLITLSALMLTLSLSGCGGDDEDTKKDTSTATDGGSADGGIADGGSGADGGGGGADGGPSGGEVEVCSGTPTPKADPGVEGCSVEKTGTKGTLIVGDLLMPGGKVIAGGGVIIEAGKLTCVGCDCATKATDHTWVLCPKAVVSPGLIDAHNHVGWLNGRPWVPKEAGVDPALRWEHRHDWRKGKGGNPKVSVSGGGASTDQKAFGELRYILTGGTAIFGSGDLSGLMRDLDATGSGKNGLGQPGARYDTFPLSDSSGTKIDSGCGYSKNPGPTTADAWAPHVSEGIDAAARNEFLCMSGQQTGGKDAISASIALIHGVGLTASDFGLLAAKGGKLIWSPRSNVSLYGDTARVTMAHKMGVSIGLGVDWLPSGSMNMVRELSCAAYLNDYHFNGYFKDWQLWEMATIGAARALAMDDAMGMLKVGHAGDIAVFNRPEGVYHRAIIDSKPSDTLLVIRGGVVLAGSEALVTKLEPSCESIGDVCGAKKAVCVKSSIGKSWADLKASIGTPNYPLFACEQPQDEPSCVPARALKDDSVNGSNNYTNAANKSDPKDPDGDGLVGDNDNCPTVFNPIRPLDNGKQADSDGDGKGDACDVCPTDADTDKCKTVDPNDLDGDGIASDSDNCPQKSNADQADKDKDGKGDVCDPCPDYKNPGSEGCLVTIKDVKTKKDLMEQRVAIKGVVVSSLEKAGFFVQTAGGATDHGGLYCYAGKDGVLPKRGQIIDITGGTVTTFYDQKQVTAVTFKDTGKTETVTARELDEAAVKQLVETDKFDSIHDGLLIVVKSVEVTDDAPAPGAGSKDAINEFVVAGGLRVDDAIYTGDDYPKVKKGSILTSVTGPVSYRNGMMKLLPRDGGDIALGAPEVAAVTPASAFQWVGKSGATLPSAMTVTLSHAPEKDMALEVSVDDTTIADVVGGPFLVKAGEKTVSVGIDGKKAGKVQLSAKVKGGSKTVTATITVIAADSIPDVVSVTPKTAKLATNASQVFTVALSHPAPALGLEVTVTMSPDDGSIGTAPKTLKFIPNAQTATFTFKAATKTAKGTLSVGGAAGGKTIDVAIDVVDPSTLSVDLSGWQLVQTSADRTYTFPKGTLVSPGGYIVIARKSSKSTFETFWKVTLGSNVVYIDANDKGGPSINGGETFTLKDATGKVIDGPTIKLEKGSKANYQRKLPVGKAGDAASWVTAGQDPGTTTPGTGQKGTAGQSTPYISEFSDASGTGAYVNEFVEIHVPLG